MPPAQVGATGHHDTSAVLYARLSGALAPPTPKPLRLDPPTWGAPAARVRKRPDSVCQVALETKRATRETPVSLQQLGCALSPWTHVELPRDKEPCNETERRLEPSHGTSPQSILSPAFAFGRPSQHSLAQLSTLAGRQPIVMSVSRLWRTCTITNRNGRHDQQ